MPDQPQFRRLRGVVPLYIYFGVAFGGQIVVPLFLTVGYMLLGGWDFPMATPMQAMCVFVLPWAVGAALASTAGYAPTLLLAPRRGRTTDPRGYAIGVALALIAPWLGLGLAEWLVADMHLQVQVVPWQLGHVFGVSFVLSLLGVLLWHAFAIIRPHEEAPAAPARGHHDPPPPSTFVVESVSHDADVLMVRCGGAFGVGAAGNPSAARLREAIGGWLDAHPDTTIQRIDVDFRAVTYEYGDGPVAGLVPFIDRGRRAIRLRASPANREPLANLCAATRLPRFTVVADDD
jgi:hypothetical protein